MTRARTFAWRADWASTRSGWCSRSAARAGSACAPSRGARAEIGCRYRSGRVVHGQHWREKWRGSIGRRCVPTCCSSTATKTKRSARSFDLPYLKAIAMGGEGGQGVDWAARYPGATALLLDSHAVGGAGGSGRTFDWSRIPRAPGKTVPACRRHRARKRVRRRPRRTAVGRGCVERHRERAGHQGPRAHAAFRRGSASRRRQLLQPDQTGSSGPARARNHLASRATRGSPLRLGAHSAQHPCVATNPQGASRRPVAMSSATSGSGLIATPSPACGGFEQVVEMFEAGAEPQGVRIQSRACRPVPPRLRSRSRVQQWQVEQRRSGRRRRSRAWPSKRGLNTGPILSGASSCTCQSDGPRRLRDQQCGVETAQLRIGNRSRSPTGAA